MYCNTQQTNYCTFIVFVCYYLNFLMKVIELVLMIHKHFCLVCCMPLAPYYSKLNVIAIAIFSKQKTLKFEV